MAPTSQSSEPPKFPGRFKPCAPLVKVALLMPGSWQIARTGRPISTRLSEAMTWLSLNLDFFT
jgi:hypothetical protein